MFRCLLRLSQNHQEAIREWVKQQINKEAAKQCARSKGSRPTRCNRIVARMWVSSSRLLFRNCRLQVLLSTRQSSGSK